MPAKAAAANSEAAIAAISTAATATTLKNAQNCYDDAQAETTECVVCEPQSQPSSQAATTPGDPETGPGRSPSPGPALSPSANNMSTDNQHCHPPRPRYTNHNNTRHNITHNHSLIDDSKGHPTSTTTTTEGLPVRISGLEFNEEDNAANNKEDKIENKSHNRLGFPVTDSVSPSLNRAEVENDCQVRKASIDSGIDTSLSTSLESSVFSSSESESASSISTDIKAVRSPRKPARTFAHDRTNSISSSPGHHSSDDGFADVSLREPASDADLATGPFNMRIGKNTAKNKDYCFVKKNSSKLTTRDTERQGIVGDVILGIKKTPTSLRAVRAQGGLTTARDKMLRSQRAHSMYATFDLAAQLSLKTPSSTTPNAATPTQTIVDRDERRPGGCPSFTAALSKFSRLEQEDDTIPKQLKSRTTQTESSVLHQSLGAEATAPFPAAVDTTNSAVAKVASDNAAASYPASPLAQHALVLEGTSRRQQLDNGVVLRRKQADIVPGSRRSAEFRDLSKRHTVVFSGQRAVARSHAAAAEMRHGSCFPAAQPAQQRLPRSFQQQNQRRPDQENVNLSRPETHDVLGFLRGFQSNHHHHNELAGAATSGNVDCSGSVYAGATENLYWKRRPLEVSLIGGGGIRSPPIQWTGHHVRPYNSYISTKFHKNCEQSTLV